MVNLTTLLLRTRAVPVPAKTKDSSAHLSKSPPHQPSIIEYSSTAPAAPSSSNHAANGSEDEAIPSHLYSKLPDHVMETDANGNKVPDYLRMILMSKVYSSPLNLQETPLTLAVNLSARLGNEIWLKREDLQPVFSFKIRGAYNMMAHLSETEKKKGVITCSAGNHAQGVALSSQALAIPALVVMPVSTPSIKWRNVQRLGATVLLFGADFDASKAECLRLATKEGYTFIPPFDDPYIIAGQGTIAVEITRQIKDCDTLDGIFGSIGGGGLMAGIGAYMKRVAKPSVGVYGVETFDADAMQRSMGKGKRVLLDEVGPFADGTAVRIVGEESFRVCNSVLDEVVCVDNDEICAAIKDVFEGVSLLVKYHVKLTPGGPTETRSIPEPSGALALAGLKAYIMRNNLQNKNKRFVAIISGGNMNFGRLRFVAERAELGERREVLMSVKVPERAGTFVKLHSLLGSRAVTEFSYRHSSASSSAYIICSFLLLSSPSSASGPSPEARKKEVGEIVDALAQNGMEGVDLSEDEFAKSHVRHLVGGRSEVKDERLFRFEFPERPGALSRFLNGMKGDWNITLFHYRNHGADVGKVLVGIQVPEAASEALNDFLQELGYKNVEETDNPVYRHFLCDKTE
ncbi:threonine dehydratase, partial [Tremellales sp. Uapishka_1]